MCPKCAIFCTRFGTCKQLTAAIQAWSRGSPVRSRACRPCAVGRRTRREMSGLPLAFGRRPLDRVTDKRLPIHHVRCSPLLRPRSPARLGAAPLARSPDVIWRSRINRAAGHDPDLAGDGYPARGRPHMARNRHYFNRVVDGIGRVDNGYGCTGSGSPARPAARDRSCGAARSAAVAGPCRLGRSRMASDRCNDAVRYGGSGADSAEPSIAP
ncbi:hypothetical protein SAMN02983003_2058 [Devosia enhydra]|uniref:Uncharacterized protein n=1 Tax=Devosia enhydra TaxID=665118 RepID=A0A1K2HXT4_9HYPH|nr:hypothetical protein SAMN02983003_2058 [Devosia enhydra]